MIRYAISDLADRPERFGDYVAQAPLPDLAGALAAHRPFATLLPALDLQRAYAPGKWSAASVLLHLADTERVFAYRALRIARGDATPLPGFDQDLFAANDDAGGRDLASLCAELDAVRAATIALADGLGAEALARRGVCSGISVSAGALLFAITGHHQHHLQVLRERYAA